VGREQRSGSLSVSTKKLYLGRKHVVLFVATAVTSIAIAVFILLSILTPVAVIGGGIVEGVVSFTSSRVYVLGKPVVFRAIESVSIISLGLFIGVSITIFFSIYGLAKLLLSKKEMLSIYGDEIEIAKVVDVVYLEYIPSSGLVAMLLVALFIALLRVAVADIVSALPLGGCVSTLAGMLCLERSRIIYTPLYIALLKNPWILIVLALLPLALSSIAIYIEFELYRKQIRNILTT
jgi:hypothetical protein